MSDVRLIDANALPMYKVKIVHSFGIVEGSVVFPDDIKNAPTIDAVPVVRCRECVHAMVFRTGSVSCRYHDWCRIPVDPDGYCNHGEKDVDDLGKPEDCRYYTENSYWGAGCLGTKEIDRCEGEGCKRWKPKMDGGAEK